jgi:hypothetical protein
LRKVDERFVEPAPAIVIEYESDASRALEYRVPPGVASQRQRACGSDALRVDDLVRRALFQYAVLMNARFVRERILPDDGFVLLNGHARCA